MQTLEHLQEKWAPALRPGSAPDIEMGRPLAPEDESVLPERMLTAVRDSRLSRNAAAIWAWWVEEMAGLVPDRLLRRKPAPAAQIRVERDRVEIERVADGIGERFIDERPIAAFDDLGWAELNALTEGCRTRLLIGSPTAHSMRLTLPKAARARVRAAVGLQLHQASPIDPELLEWTAQIAGAGADHIDVRVAMVRRRTIDELRCLFVENGLALPSIDVKTPDGPICILKARNRGARSMANPQRLAIAGSLALIATIPFTTIAGAKLLTSITEGRIAVLEREIQPRIEANRRARQAETVRRALRPISLRPSASAAIEEVAALLPASAYLRAIEQDAGRTLKLTIDAGDSGAVEAAIANAKTLRRAQVTDQTAGEEGRTIMTVQAAQ